MASIVGKKKGNQTYYYVVTSGRVHGKPRITHQTYLGTAERLAQLVRDKAAPFPLEATARDCGLPAALWQAARLSGAFDALLSVWPAPAQGPSIAHFLLLAAFHRICAPGPKTAVADWYRHSILPDLWGYAPRQFTSQAFWDHFDAIDVSDSLGVLRHSAGFAAEQFQSVGTSLAKATQKLRALAREVSQPKARHTEQGLRSRIQRWLQPTFVAQALSYELRRAADRSWELQFAIDTDALQRLLAERFGRTTLVTNRLDWTPAQVAVAYNGQQHMERVFRGLKGGQWLGWGPLHHWTDSKIRVHAFYCLLGVSLLQYLHHKAQAVWPTLTMEGLKHELGQIQRIDLLYPPLREKGPPRVATVTSKQTLTQTALASELQLDELLKAAGG